MLTGSSRKQHARAAPRGGIIPGCTASSLCFSSKEPHHAPTTGTRRGINISGVDFWHAVEFSRNGSFLRDRFTGPSGLSLRCVPTLSEDFPSELPPPFRERAFPRASFGAVVPGYWSGPPDATPAARSWWGG